MERKACPPSEGPQNIPVTTGRGQYGVGSVPTRARRVTNRCLKAVRCSEMETNPQYRGSQTSLPSTLRLVLLNARSVSNKTQLIYDLILDENADLACITETWIGREGGPPSSHLPARLCCPTPGQTRGTGGSSYLLEVYPRGS